jgi:hypothetical protein
MSSPSDSLRIAGGQGREGFQIAHRFNYMHIAAGFGLALNNAIAFFSPGDNLIFQGITFLTAWWSAIVETSIMDAMSLRVVP